MSIGIYITLLALLVALAGWLCALTGTLKRYLHLLQLEDYSPRRMWRIIIRRPILLQPLGFELIGALVIIAAGFIAVQDVTNRVYSDPWPKLNVGLTGAFINWFLPIGWTIWGLGCAWRGWQVRRTLRKAKKSLVMTARARRIFWTGLAFSLAVFFVLTLIVFSRYFTKTAVLGAAIMMPADAPKTWLIVAIKASVFLWMGLLAAMYLVERTGAIHLTVSIGLLWPVENAIQRRYLKEARRILSEMNPQAIGITGSYGKTGTKELLSAMLATKYNVFRPPGSYNTLMGVTRVVRESLRPFHELFVVEMGAYRIGTIERLCRLVGPRYGILTGIGVQHLERFKSREAIRLAKAELVMALPSDGIAVLNGDDPLCRRIGASYSGEVVYFSVRGDEITSDGTPQQDYTPPAIAEGDDKFHTPPAIAGGDDKFHTPPAIAGGDDKFHTPPAIAGGENGGVNPQTIHARNITITSSGSDFELLFPDGEVLPVHLSLLGRSAVANATAAAAMADRLGVARRDIAGTLASMPHVRHRLEPIPGEGGVRVLDDAYNSNPIGARDALELLSTTEGGRRILVTPGMVELGPIEEQANYQFGRQAATACDLAVLVGGKRVEPIREGLLNKGFSSEKIWVVPTLNEGLDRLKGYLKPGDTMLLENDLPDQYDSL